MIHKSPEYKVRRVPLFGNVLVDRCVWSVGWGLGVGTWCLGVGCGVYRGCLSLDAVSLSHHAGLKSVWFAAWARVNNQQGEQAPNAAVLGPEVQQLPRGAEVYALW